MNPWRVAEEFRIVGEIDLNFIGAGLKCVNEQAGGVVEFPRAVFSAACRPLAGSSQIATADVTISVESHAQDAELTVTSGALHDRLLQIVRRKFLGDSDATASEVRAAIAALIGSRGFLEIAPRYVPIASAQALEAHRFKTPITLRCGVFMPSV